MISSTKYASLLCFKSKSITSIFFMVSFLFAIPLWAQVPVIKSFSPASVKVGGEVTILGSNFDTNVANNLVYFGAVSAKIKEVTESKIIVYVPVQASNDLISVYNLSTKLSCLSAQPFFPKHTIVTDNDIPKLSSFEPRQITTGFGLKTFCIGDMNGDGFVDIMFINASTNSITVLPNISSKAGVQQSFTSRIELPSAINPYDIKVFDVDADGKLDIIVSNAGADVVSVYKNTSSLTAISFNNAITFATGKFPQNIKIADMDSDGRPDIIVSNRNGNSISILKNISNGNISFAAKVDVLTGGSPRSLDVADVNGDNYPEMLVVNEGNDKAVVFQNDCTAGVIKASSFEKKTQFEVQDEIKDAVFCDIDGDGRPEMIVLANQWMRISVFKNINQSTPVDNSSFASAIDFGTNYRQDKINLGDVNSDGKVDLVLHSSDTNYGSCTLLNASVPGIINSTSFKQFNYIPVEYATNFFVCDLDGDGVVEWISNNTYNNAIVFVQAKVDYPKPVIKSFAPSKANVGSLVTITGDNFNSNATGNIVHFGNLKAEVIGATASQLQVRVPVGANTNFITVTDAVSQLLGTSSLRFVPTHTDVSEIVATNFYPKGTVDLKSNVNPIVADIDGDGKPDLLMVNNSLGSFSVFTGNVVKGDLQASSFNHKYEFFGLAYINKIQIADLNGDGKKDVILSYTNGYHIFTNISTLGKVAFANGYVKNLASYVVEQILDVNDDGKIDFGVLDSKDVRFIYNYFVPKYDFDFSLRIGAPIRFSDYYTNFYETEDLDGDGKFDVVGYGASTKNITLARNTTAKDSASPIFENKIEVEVGLGTRLLKLGDLDGDGKPDIIISNTLTNTVNILRNTSVSNSLSFDKVISLPAVSPRSIVLEDFNGDGKLDICIINGDNLISIYQNNSQQGSLTLNSFGQRVDVTVGSMLEGIYASDLDGDGRPDLVLTNGNNPLILLQNIPIEQNLTIKTSAQKTVFKMISNQPKIPVAIDDQVLVTSGSILGAVKAKIYFASNYLPKEDLLALRVDNSKMGDPNASFDKEKGVLEITAPTTTTQTQWQEILRAVTYENINTQKPALSEKKINFEIYNNAFRSNNAEKNLLIEYVEKSDANLRGVGLNFGRLYPLFHKDSTAYKIYVGNAISTITITPNAVDASANIEINGIVVTAGQISPISLNIGDNSIVIKVTAQDGIVVKTYNFSVYRSDQPDEILFKGLSEATYGDNDITLNAFSTRFEVPITYTSSNSAVAYISNGKIKIVGAGVTTITASTNVSAIVPVNRTLTVKKAPLIVKANDASRIYQGTDPFFTATYSGFLKEDNVYKLSGQLQFTSTANKNSLVGNYVVNAAGLGSLNYEIKYLPGIFRIVTDVDVTPGIDPMYFTLNASGTKALELKDITKITKYGLLNAGAALNPAVLTCNNLGKQIVKITSTNGNPLNSGVSFNSPSGVAVDKEGNIYVGDSGNHLIRKISTSGLVTTFAGSGISGLLDGSAYVARFNNPRGLTFDKDGNLYVGDGGAFGEQGCIRKITPNGDVTTIFKGENPGSLVIDKAGNIYFVGSRNSGRGNLIFKLSPTRVLSVFNPNYEIFDTPTSISLDKEEHYLYVACYGSNGYRKVKRFDLYGFPQTLSGNTFVNDQDNFGTYYENPLSVLAGSSGQVYIGVANKQLNTIPYDRSLNLIGQSSSLIKHPTAMALDLEGNIIIADVNQHSILKVTTKGEITIIAGNGRQGASNGDLSLGNNGEVFSMEVPIIVKSRPEITSTLSNVDIPLNAAGKGEIPDFTNISFKNSCANLKAAVTQSVLPGTLIEPFKAVPVVITVTDEYGGEDSRIFNVTAKGLPLSIVPKSNLKFNLDPSSKEVKLKFEDLATVDNPLSLPYTVEINPFVFNCELSDKQEVTATIKGGLVGKASNAGFRLPRSIARDRAGNFYIADSESNKIRKVTPVGDVSTFAGDGASGMENGPGTTARFNYPRGIVVDPGGNVYVADYGNNRIRKINSQGVVSVFGGDGTYYYLDHYSNNARTNMPVSLAADQHGNIYFTSVECTLRKISKEGLVTTVVGGNSCGLLDGQGENAKMYGNADIACDKEGNVYMADAESGYIRKVTSDGRITTLPMSNPVYGMKGIAIDNKGDIYLIKPNSYYGSAILKFSTNGALLKTIYVVDSGVDKMVYANFESIAFDDEGNILVVDSFNGALHKVTIDNGVLTTIASRIFREDFDGNIGNTNAISSNVKIPVEILSVPLFKGTYPDLNVKGDNQGDIILSDYASVANAVDLCGGMPLSVSQSPAAGTNVPSGTTVTLTAINKNNNKASVSFKVYHVPIPIIVAEGPTTFNFGSSVRLRAEPGIGYTYQWKRNGMNITGATFPYYTATESGTYTVTIRISTISQTSESAIIKVVLPAPIVSSFFPVTGAKGSLIEIRGSHFTEATKVSFGGVEASSFHILSPSLITAVVAGGSSGAIEVTTTTGNHALPGFSYVPIPTIIADGSTDIVVGANVRLTANPSNGFTYQWIKDGYYIYNSNSATLEVTDAGVYAVTISKDNVSQTSLEKVITVKPLPANNFRVAASDVVCIGQNNGMISISGTISTNYIATVSNSVQTLTYNFTKDLIVRNLKPGTYEVCLKSNLLQTDVKCYTLQINEPKSLSAYVANIKNNNVTLELAGANVYFIKINGNSYSTSDSIFIAPLTNGANQISVTSDKPCQGKVEQQITLASEPLIYPNPFQKYLNVNLGVDKANLVEVTVYSLDGKLVSKLDYANVRGALQLDFSSLDIGLYLMRLSVDRKQTIFKILKK